MKNEGEYDVSFTHVETTLFTNALSHVCFLLITGKVSSLLCSLSICRALNWDCVNALKTYRYMSHDTHAHKYDAIDVHAV